MDWDDCGKCKYAKLGINEEPCDKCVNGDGDSSSKNKFEPREVKMKTYKTWEVIKMLTENPKLEFKNKEGYGAAICGDMFNITGGTDVSRRFHIYDEWELAQEPVSFMEAVKAYTEGKTIRCELGEGVEYNNTYKRGNLPNIGGYNVKNVTNVAVGTKEILEGKWFIE